MVDLANTVWRDFSTAGIPASGKKKPEKSKIREWGTYLESLTTAAGYGNTVWFATKALLDADLAHAAGIPAIVYADTTAANNGIYIKSGASGLGSWGQIITYLPGYQFVTATDAGAGTANAIVATSSPRVAYTDGVQLVRLNIFETNTSTAVTVAFDGGAALTIQTAAGNAPAIGGLAAGMTVLGVVDQSASVFRLLSDQASAAVLSGAEAALASLLERYLGSYVDDAAATTAAGTPTTGQLYWNETDDILKSWNGAGWVSAIQAAGNITISTDTGDGGTSYTLDASAESTNTILSIGGLVQSAGYTLVAGALEVTGGIPSGVPIQGISFEIVPLGATTSALVSLPSGITLQSYLNACIVLPVEYGAVGDGVTDDTAALQAMFDGAAAGSMIYLGGKTYKYTTLTISKKLSIYNGHLASDKADSGDQITVARLARVEFHDVELSGGGVATTAVVSHNIIAQYGTSRTVRGVGMAFCRCHIHGAGLYGIFGEWIDDVVIEDCHFSDIAYGGVTFLSPHRATVRGGLFEMLTAVGSGGNAYGVAFTHDSSGYSADPNAGTPLAANHFPVDCVIDGATFHGPKIWEAMDFHGGYGCRFVNNTIHAAKHPIAAGNSSGDAANYSGYNNVIANNVIDIRMPDGTASGVTPGYGIVIQGGSAASSMNIHCTGNTIRGYGNATPNTNSVSILVSSYVDRGVISGNIIDSWVGYAIWVSIGSGALAINDNVFSAMSAASPTDSACVWIGDATGRISVMGNVYRGGTHNPYYGLRVAASVTGYVSYGSDFRSAANSEYSDLSGNGRFVTWA